ncbi:DUF167 domain-containing protein [Candidatus Aenigmatarchaeota archaeon]
MVTIKAKIKPNSKSFAICFDNDVAIISTKSKAEDNKANIEIIKKLQRLTKKRVEIAKGLKSKNKIIVIHDTKLDEIKNKLIKG